MHTLTPLVRMIFTSCIAMCRPAPTDCLKDDQQMYRGSSNVAHVHSDTTESVYFVAMCPMGRAGGHRAGPGSKPSKGEPWCFSFIKILINHSHLGIDIPFVPFCAQDRGSGLQLGMCGLPSCPATASLSCLIAGSTLRHIDVLSLPFRSMRNLLQTSAGLHTSHLLALCSDEHAEGHCAVMRSSRPDCILSHWVCNESRRALQERLERSAAEVMGTGPWHSR